MRPKIAIQTALKVLSAITLMTGSIFSQDNSNSVQQIAGDLDSYFTSTLASQNYVGLGACLIKDGRVIWENSYGYRDRENKIQLRTDDIYQLASLSKTVTATALMQLYENGLFRLDDDVNNYIPIKVRNPNFPDKPITFRMLLTHTASFSDLLPAGNKISLGVRGDSPIPFGEFVEELFTPGGRYYAKDYFSINEPGTKYEYSNIAFSLIGYLVEKLTKKDFSEYCKERIFRPLEMNNTGWHLRDLDTSRIVFGYGFPDNENSASYKKVRHFGVPGYPEGMLRTTMQDMANFLLAFINGGRFKSQQLLKPETVELMLNPQGIKNIPTRSFKITDIGLTWLIFEVEGEQLYSMNGFSGSIFTNAYFSPKDRTGIIYYFTGITMKNMPASIEMTRKLFNSLKMVDLSLRDQEK
ncbi:MAG: serine hydrolase domain-containing protein [archaeon]